MLRAYKYRLYPTEEQKQHLIQAMGCIRFIYNQALKIKIKHYEETGKGLSYFDLQNTLLLSLKREYEWLLLPTAQSLQMALRNLDNAFTRFFHKQANFPKFKAKYDNRQSVQYPQYIRVDWKSSKIIIPKCGEVLAVLHRKFQGKIKTCTVSKTPTGKFFISILVDNEKELPVKFPILSETTIGLDLGIKDFATLSDGTKFANPKHLKNSLKKLKAAQKKLSRKKKGSKNRNKERLKVAKIYEKITNQRKDFLHQLSSSIIYNSDIQTIVLEDLGIVNMLKNHKLALAISDCGWGNFTDMLAYKAEWSGKNIIYIGRFDPSSKMCSHCGWIKKDLKLDDREWECNQCHTHHDRDVNAAINIKKFGLIQAKSGQELSVEPDVSEKKQLPKGREIPGRSRKKTLRSGSKKQEKICRNVRINSPDPNSSSSR